MTKELTESALPYKKKDIKDMNLHNECLESHKEKRR